MAFICIVL